MLYRNALAAGVGCAAILAATTAMAATSPQIFNTGVVIQEPEFVNQRIELPLFDDDGGTRVLTEVRVLFEYGYFSDVSGTNNSSSSATFRFNPIIDFDLSDHTPRQGSFLTTLLPGFSINETEEEIVAAGATIEETFDSIFSAGPAFVPSSEFGNWIAAPGDNVFGVTLNTESFINCGFSGGVGSCSQDTDVGYFLGVRYTFEDRPVDVIPLPAAGWLLLTGVFGLGGLGWMRRRAA